MGSPQQGYGRPHPHRTYSPDLKRRQKRGSPARHEIQTEQGNRRISINGLDRPYQPPNPCRQTRRRNFAIRLFFGGRRRDEIANARYRFLEKAPWGAFRYYLHHSKTDQTGKGLQLEVKAKNTKNLKNWIKAANIHDGYLFRLIDYHGNVTKRPIYPEVVNNIVKKYVEACGLDPAKYSAHGLRRGFITECGRRNIEIELAMDLFGHKGYRTARIYYEQGKIMNNPATNL